MNAKRGYVPEDDKYFSQESLEIMKTASRHVYYLINEGYGVKQASTFVGNHFLLSERQRLAIVRSVAKKESIENRISRCVDIIDLRDSTVWIDGFNTIITLEVMLSQSILFECMDGTIRDLASLRGTYRIIPETEQAIKMMLGVLYDAAVCKVNILLDEPVSNSGRLKMLIADIGDEYQLNLNIQIIKEVDRQLYNKDNVITSDSIILDNCSSWFNLVSECMKGRKTEVLKIW